MVHVIELSDEITDDHFRSTGSPRKSKPEIHTLISDDDTPKLQSQKQYPSSPREVEVIPDTSFQVTKDSREISAPFCQDLCTSIRDESSKDEDFETRPKSGKRVLEEILNEESSIGYSRNDDSMTDDIRLRSTLKRPRIVSQESCPQKTYTSARQELFGTANDIIGTKNSDASEPVADVLETYPISSPSIDINRPKNLESGQSRQLFVQSSEWSFNAEGVNENEVLSQGSVPDEDPIQNNAHPCNEAKSIPILPFATATLLDGSKHDAISGIIDTNNNISADQDGPNECGESKPLNVNVKDFLTDKKSIGQHTLPDCSLDLHQREQEVNQAELDMKDSVDEILKARKKARLAPYIVHGRCFTDDESRQLVQGWLESNKRAFKESNQIYRSNEKARSCITVTMASRLIKLFRESGCELEKGINPATLQPSVEKELPRIGFLRACESEYDFSHDIFYPCEKVAVEETLSILYYDAQVFFELYKTDKEYLFKRLRSFTKSGKYLIVVLNNLKKLERALEALEDKRYKARVQDELTGSQTTKGFGSKKKTTLLEDLGMKKYDIELRLRFIDRLWGVKIHIVSSHAEFAESLPNLVSLIAKQRMDPSIRFMQYSHINARSGKDKNDVLRQTLQQINKMPELKASSVMEAYPTFQALFSDFKKGELKSGLDGKHLMTEAMETRLYKLFTCDNPNESVQ